jgi:hypothetical protein
MAATIGVQDIDAFFNIEEVKALSGSLLIPEILLHGEEE